MFSFDFFFLTVTSSFVGEPFSAVFQKISGSQKVFGQEARGGVSRLSLQIFLSHSSGNFRKGTL